MNKVKLIPVVVIALGMSAVSVAGQSKAKQSTIQTKTKSEQPAVTFVELGSERCIPCKQMQPVMKAIEEKYGKQIKVVFYDVWKPEQEKYAGLYGVKLIPTQVFLDKDGKEFFRHEGFYPEAEIDKLLRQRGLKVRSGG